MRCIASSLPRLEYFHHQFEKIHTRLTEIDRRLNDLNQKLENTKTSVQNLESGTHQVVLADDENLDSMRDEVKEIRKLLSDSQAHLEKNRRVRLPL